MAQSLSDIFSNIKPRKSKLELEKERALQSSEQEEKPKDAKD